ncbi:DUF559 domain-containing protein [Candidatus Peregrinibacteria bacterium]|nr:DUF559 domain-containing protein [Candidatus Peregrinibacteria bacterium]MBT5468587.1 DUF559 domain-containing protein [Candidatus Peregrinibacteria bacterium]MBT7337611.1 DUF559 domain-containing protein [Candidatus Peregrinibacteria bacterium]
MSEESQHQFYKKRKCKFTKKLRRSMTPAETILWEMLRNRKFKGLKFRRQVILVHILLIFFAKNTG